MRTTFIAVWTLIAVWIAMVVPFRAALRQSSKGRPILKAWALLVVYFASLSLLLPGIVAAVDRDFSRREFHRWVPEGPAVVAMLVLGWVYPAVAYGLGVLFRQFKKKSDQQP
jgi:hypothetical protein